MSFGQISLPSFFSSSSDLWNPFIGVRPAMGSLSCCRPLFESGFHPVDGFGSQRGPHHKTTVSRTVTPSKHHTNCTKTVGRVFFPGFFSAGGFPYPAGSNISEEGGGPNSRQRALGGAPGPRLAVENDRLGVGVAGGGGGGGARDAGNETWNEPRLWSS